jgi:hypothetical protein
MQGDLKGWRRYANSLRLRALMRISYVDENKAKTDVMKMLNAPTDYPLVEVITKEKNENILLKPQITYNDNLNSALTELSSHLAPEFLLDGVLKPSNDPRIRFLFDKNSTKIDDNPKHDIWNATYNVIPTNAPSATQEDGISKGKYAVLDSITFLTNKSVPGIVFTTHEVGYLKAEAYERWGNTAAAETEYKKAVDASVRFVYYLHLLGVGNGKLKEEVLTDDEITNFLADVNVAYTGTQTDKLQKIWLQKWISFGFLQSIQNWAEVRRTKYPVLNFSVDNTGGDYSLPGSRLVYPPNEKTYNSVNYAKVAGDDTPNNKIFWDVK